MKRNSKRQTSMDRFIVRSPKKSPAPSPTKDRGGMRQATLESLRGVVVVEDMERAVVVLERSDVSTELKVDTLKHLLNKNPAKEVLIRTGLGKTVHKLCRCEDASVALAAKRVYRAWKKHILSKANRPYIEVKCDLKTQRLRNSARQMLCEGLRREDVEGGGGGGDTVGNNKNKREASETEEEKKSCTGKQGFNKERKRDVQEVKEDKERRKEKIKVSERKEEDSSRHRDKRKHREEEGDRERSKKSQRQGEEEREEKNRKKGEEKSNKQREEGDGVPQTKRIQENEALEKEEEKRKGREKCKEKHPEPTNKNSREESSTDNDSIEVLAEHIEREVYHNSQRLVDNSYRRTIRALVFTLRHQSDVRKTVNSATLSVPDFVKQYRRS